MPAIAYGYYQLVRANDALADAVVGRIVQRAEYLRMVLYDVYHDGPGQRDQFPAMVEAIRRIHEPCTVIIPNTYYLSRNQMRSWDRVNALHRAGGRVDILGGPYADWLNRCQGAVGLPPLPPAWTQEQFRAPLAGCTGTAYARRQRPS